jgi:HUS1 checkpoint protein
VYTQPTLFSDYRVQSNANNEITIVLATEPLLHVLKSATSSPEVVTKLAKRNGVPCLSFDLSLQSKQGKEVKITHDVKIMVMKPAEVELIKEPLCPAPDVSGPTTTSSNLEHCLLTENTVYAQVHIILPPLQKVRTVVDRMRSLSDVVGISANRTGQLKLSIQTQRIKADTVWSNLTNPEVGGGRSLGFSGMEIAYNGNRSKSRRRRTGGSPA